MTSNWELASVTAAPLIVADVAEPVIVMLRLTGSPGTTFWAEALSVQVGAAGGGAVTTTNGLAQRLVPETLLTCPETARLAEGERVIVAPVTATEEPLSMADVAEPCTFKVKETD